MAFAMRMLIAGSWLFVVIPAFAEASDSLSCAGGLTVHLYAPELREAQILRTRKGGDLRASKPLFTLVGTMVDRARIETYKLHQGKDGPLEKIDFVVTLDLNSQGKQAIRQTLGDRDGADLVVVCNDIVLIGFLTNGRQEPLAMAVMIDDSPQLAEQFARSFTQDVKFGREKPTPK